MNTKENSIIKDLIPAGFGWKGKLWTVVLVLFCIAGLMAYMRQLKFGLQVTGMRDFAFWGIYISNFVFFVAVSLVGSLITAILRLSNAHWSTPITRIAEIIAVSAIIFAALIIIVDMGRPDRIFFLIIYGRLQSPIVWDVIVITTYLLISILLLYYPLIADLEILRKNASGLPKWIRWIHRRVRLNWNAGSEQKRKVDKALNILCVTIIPVALAIHTVTSWLFATTYRPGWDSTNFGPYFVSGAFMVGCAAVILGMYVFRVNYQLENYITLKHFDHMGKLLVLLSLVYLYFNLNEYLVPAYKMKSNEAEHLSGLFHGDFSTMFWLVIIAGMIIPILVLLFRSGRKPLPMFIIAFFVVAGAWFKRYLIVTPTLLHPYLPIQDFPKNWSYYYPTWEEWTITLGSLAGALLIITLLVRIFPIIPIQDTLDEIMHKNLKSE